MEVAHTPARLTGMPWSCRCARRHNIPYITFQYPVDGVPERPAIHEVVGPLRVQSHR
jgi:hypothetical protein